MENIEKLYRKRDILSRKKASSLFSVNKRKLRDIVSNLSIFSISLMILRIIFVLSVAIIGSVFCVYGLFK